VVSLPRTRYAQASKVDIAFQTFGDGPRTILALTGASIPIDSVDAEPRMARFQRRLAGFGRVIRYDQRGMGLSGHLPVDAELGAVPWATDAVAVLDAAGCDRAVVFAPSTAALVGIELAARHSDRVEALILFNGAARALWAEDYPAGVPAEAVTPFIEVGVRDDALALGFDGLGILAPSVSSEEAFRTWWDRSGNRAATPSMARAMSLAVVAGDVRDRLAEITVPTLVMHRTQNLFVSVEHGRYLRDHLPGARYVELPGADTLYWVGDTEAVLGEIEEFLTGSRAGAAAERRLATILFTDIVGSTDRAASVGDSRWRDLLDSHDQLVRDELMRFGGQEVNTAGDGFVATFTSPSSALDCADAIVHAVTVLGLQVRAGLHVGEIEVRGTDIAGLAVHLAARVSAAAGAGEVYVSATVRDVVAGSSRQFADRGEHELKGVPGRWHLFAAVGGGEP
jgi:class 3 adenylate cyclase